MNTVTNWTYDQPTEEGPYLMCYGDVESFLNIRFVQVLEESGVLRVFEAADTVGHPVQGYSPRWKWARVSFGEEQG